MNNKQGSKQLSKLRGFEFLLCILYLDTFELFMMMSWGPLTPQCLTGFCELFIVSLFLSVLSSVIATSVNL